MPSPGTVYGLLTRHTFNGKKHPMMCPLNEPQLTSASPVRRSLSFELTATVVMARATLRRPKIALTTACRKRGSCHLVAVARSRLSRQPLAREHRRFGTAGAVAIWPKIRGRLPIWG